MTAASLFQTVAGPASSPLLEEMSEFVQQVEAELGRQVRSQVALVEKIGDLTLTAGGKRLRPALVSLTARATGRPYEPRRAVQLGAAVEMVHMATLIHDDVIDDAATRRGSPTAFSQFGATASILGGDVLLSKAMSLLAEDGDLEVIRTVSRSVVELAEGEVLELQLRGKIAVTTEEHRRVLRMKTAGLLECCCVLGSLVSEASPAETDALATYGHHLGMAFQFVDDALDYSGDSSKTGKPVGTDLRDGQATLPLLLGLPKLPAATQTLLQQRFGELTEEEVSRVASEIARSGAVEDTLAVASAEADAACAALSLLPDHPARNLLSTVAKFVVKRTH